MGDEDNFISFVVERVRQEGWSYMYMVGEVGGHVKQTVGSFVNTPIKPGGSKKEIRKS